MLKKILSSLAIFSLFCIPSVSAKLLLSVGSIPPVVDADTYTLIIYTTPGAKVTVTGGTTEIPPQTDSDQDGELEIMVALIQNSKNTLSIRAEKGTDSSDTVQVVIKESAEEALIYSQNSNTDITPPNTPTLDEYLDKVNADYITLTGIAEAKSTIIATKTDGTKLASTITKTDQTFSIKFPLEQNQRNRINISARDAAGNTSKAVQAIIVEDPTALQIVEIAEQVKEENETQSGSDIAKPFNDITNHWAEEYINTLRLAGVISGKSPGIYGPDDFLTRAELTKIALNTFGIVTVIPTEKPFDDVELFDWYAPYIAKAKSRSIVQGYQNGFLPNKSITRAEALKILLSTAEFEIIDGESGFSDIETGAWYDKYVAFAKNNQIVSGYSDGSFRPNAPITRAEIAKITVKTMELYTSIYAQQQNTTNETTKTNTKTEVVNELRTYTNQTYKFSFNFYKNWYYESETGSGDTILKIAFADNEEALKNGKVFVELKNNALADLNKMNLSTETSLEQIKYFLEYNTTKHIEIYGEITEKEKMKTMAETLELQN